MPYFGHADDFPLQWHKTVSESSSASSCVNTIQDFLEGYGFSDPELEKKIVNSRGQTLFQIHQETCKSFGEFEGFYWLLKYNALGKITDWTVLPFENCRLGKPDDKGYISKIYYNPFFGTKEYAGKQKKMTVVYDCYNPSAVLSQYAEQKGLYKGQVLFVGTSTATSRFYPFPKAVSAVKAMKTEAGVADYHESNVNNSFLQPFMLAMIGDPNAPVRNPDSDSDTGEPRTAAEEVDDIISNNFMGAKRVGNMWVSWYANKDEIPIPIPMPSNNTGDYFITLDNQCTKKITIAFNVVPILANIHEGVSLGGDGNMLRVAVKMQQQRAKKGQRVLTDNYQKILIQFDKPYNEEVDIAPYNPYPELEVLDDKIWAAMSDEEKRNWIEENTEITLIDEAQTVQEPGQVTPPQQNRLLNAVPVAFPDSVRNQVKRSLEYIDKMQIKCGGKAGRQVSEAIMNNENMGLKQLKRIHSFVKKHSQHENKPFNDGCDVILYNAWGGKEMEKFLETELQRMNAWLN